MGIFYHPPNPNVGNQQPLEQWRLTPPISGTTPQNPPFMGGAKVSAAVLACWAAAGAVVAWEFSPPTLQAAPRFNPAVFASNPPVVGRSVPLTVLINWIPPDPAPITARLLNPPLSGPPPQNPPVNGGALFPLASQVWWIPPPAQPPVAINLNPPISGPTAQNPPLVGSKIPAATLISWLPPDPPFQVGQKITPPSGTNLVPLLPTRIPYPELVWWILPAPQPPVAVPLNPPISGPTPQNPPITGARVPGAVLTAWLPSDPAFQTAWLLNPPIGFVASPPPSVGSYVPAAVLVSWPPPDPAFQVARLLSPPISAPVIAFPFPPLRTPDGVFAWWQVPPPAFQVGRVLVPPLSGPIPIIFPSRGLPPGLDWYTQVTFWQGVPLRSPFVLQSGPSTIRDVTCLANVRSRSLGDTPFVPSSEQAQDAIMVIISPTPLRAAGWPSGATPVSTTPGIELAALDRALALKGTTVTLRRFVLGGNAGPSYPQRGDFIVIRGISRVIKVVDPIFIGGELVRIEMSVEG